MNKSVSSIILQMGEITHVVLNLNVLVSNPHYCLFYLKMFIVQLMDAPLFHFYKSGE